MADIWQATDPILFFHLFRLLSLFCLFCLLSLFCLLGLFACFLPVYLFSPLFPHFFRSGTPFFPKNSDPTPPRPLFRCFSPEMQIRHPTEGAGSENLAGRSF